MRATCVLADKPFPIRRFRGGYGEERSGMSGRRVTRYGISIKSVVTGLIIINVVVFLLSGVVTIPLPGRLIDSLMRRGNHFLAAAFQRYGLFVTVFSLFPILIRSMGWVWQVFTYMFLHGSLLHLFFNMYALLLFGRPLEQRWGRSEFFLYYICTGVGAGITTFVWNLLRSPMVPTIGASGAIFGLVLAFGLEFPETMLLLFFFIPVKARYAALIFGGIELVMILTGSMQGIGHFTHLAGILFGFLYYLLRIKRGRSRRVLKGNRLVTTVRSRLKAARPVRKSEVIQKAEIIRNKIVRDLTLSDEEENLMKILHAAFIRDSSLCGPDRFDPKAGDCLRCEAFYACLYRYVLDLQ